jgi:hypothetical protein
VKKLNELSHDASQVLYINVKLLAIHEVISRLSYFEFSAVL